jgi:hypothetical protein
MAQAQVYEGTPDQLVEQLSKLPKARKYRVTVISDEAEAAERQPDMIAFGMFPQLLALTEEDFKSAERRGEDIGLWWPPNTSSIPAGQIARFAGNH